MSAIPKVNKPISAPLVLRSANELKAERGRRVITSAEQKHAEGMIRVTRAIEATHKDRGTWCVLYGIPDSVVSELCGKGYQVSLLEVFSGDITKHEIAW